MQGLFVWWRRPLMEFPEVEVERDGGSTSGGSQEFLKAWEEAHKLFRAKKESEGLQQHEL
jgi:hypothetical protein